MKKRKPKFDRAAQLGYKLAAARDDGYSVGFAAGARTVKDQFAAKEKALDAEDRRLKIAERLAESAAHVADALAHMMPYNIGAVIHHVEGNRSRP